MTRDLRILLGFHGYVPDIHRGIVEFARPKRWFLELYGLPNRELFFRADPDAILTSLGPDTRLLEMVKRATCPVVDTTLNEPEIAVNRVVVDNRRMGELAAEYFCHRRYRHYVFLANRGGADIHEQFEGFRGGVSARIPGGTVDALLLGSEAGDEPPHADFSAGVGSLLRYLSATKCPLAVYCPSDILGAQAIDTCLAAGVDVPGDVSVLAAGNNALVCESLPVSLSSIDPGYANLGRLAAARLESLIARPESSARTSKLAPAGVVTRESSNHYVVTRPEIRAALRRIGSEFANPDLDVQEVADGVGLSKGRLSAGFREEMGHGIAAEIRYIRLEWAKLLLRRGVDVRTACRASGFSNVASFRKAFQRSTGCNPGAYAEV